MNRLRSKSLLWNYNDFLKDLFFWFIGNCRSLYSIALFSAALSCMWYPVFLSALILMFLIAASLSLPSLDFGRSVSTPSALTSSRQMPQACERIFLLRSGALLASAGLIGEGMPVPLVFLLFGSRWDWLVRGEESVLKTSAAGLWSAWRKIVLNKWELDH